MQVRTIPFGKPLIGQEEKDAVLSVLDGPVLVHGPRTASFESSFAAWTGSPGAVSVSSCTAGMHLLYFDLEIGPGDEVIVPAQTHTATAHAVELTGARAVFADSEPTSGNVDVQAVEASVTGRTRAIAVVHYLGEPVDMEPIVRVARKHGLFLLEDCALALGTTVDDVHAGLMGDAGVFSFYPVKHMTSAEGGMVISRDLDRLSRVSRKRAFGVDRTAGERSIPGVYDVTMLGFNYRMNEIQAAIGEVQVGRLDAFLKSRRENQQILRDELADVEELSVLHASHGSRQSSYYCVSAVLKESVAHLRSAVVTRLKHWGIGTSVYYPRPVPLMTYYQNRYGYTRDTWPVASWISESSIALPVGPHLDGDDMAHVAAGVKKAILEASNES